MTGNEWEDAFERAKAFVAELTLEEKAKMVTGQPGPCVGNIEPVERLGFNGLCLQDGPLANRVADYVSVFQAGVSAASTWDREILHQRGLLMGREFKAKGAHVALSYVNANNLLDVALTDCSTALLLALSAALLTLVATGRVSPLTLT